METLPNPPIAARFSRLFLEWKEAVKYSSDLEQICTHPAYLKMIGMGEQVLPFIFDSLNESPQYWFVALESITGENPVKPESRGRIKLMTRDWLEWASRNGFS